MANDSNKVLSVGNLKVLKDYIDKTGGTNREVISEEMKSYLDKELVKASNNLSKEYEKEFTNLSNRIAEVEATGTPEELAELRLELDALNNNFNDKNLALTTLDEDLKRLSGDFSALYEGIETGSVFSAGQLNQVIKTALIDKTVITDDMVSTPNVFATQMVALIANMGHINAGSIDAGTIAGSNIESIHKISGTNDPVWVINDEGDGWLAKKNIQWDKNGNVTFGPDVKISWNSVDGGDDVLKDKWDNYSSDVKDYIHNYVIDHTDNAVTQDQLKAAYDNAHADIETVKQTMYDNELAAEEKREALQEAINSTAEALTLDYKKEVGDLELRRQAAEAGLQQAIADGNQELIEEYSKLKGEINGEVKALQAQFGGVYTAVAGLEGRVTNAENALNPNQMADVLAASLITTTQVGEDFVHTPNLLAKEITALMGTFGDISANNLEANTIEGFTVQAPTAIRDEEGIIQYNWENDPDNPGVLIPTSVKRKRPTWQLNYDGSGFVGRKDTTGSGETEEQWAKRGITWDETGNITLGEGVTIKWNAVEGGSDALDDAYNQISGEYGTAITTAVNSAKTELNKNITDAEARAKKEAADKAAELSKDLSDLETNVTNLSNSTASASTLNTLITNITNWTSDSMLSPVEVKELKDDQAKIKAEYDKLVSDIGALNGKL